MFNLQYRSGTFDPSKCLTENNNIANANLRPDIYPTLIKKDRGYTLELLTELLGESGKGVREVSQRTYEWSVQGRPVRPITFKGYTSLGFYDPHPHTRTNNTCGIKWRL